MDIGTQHRALALMRRIIDSKRCTVPAIATRPQKPACRIDAPIQQPFPRRSPESQGISSDHIAGFLEAIQNDNTLDPHSIMILCNGIVIAEGAFGAYDLRVWHITHSACKSITSLAVGILIDEGKLSLDEPIVKIFENNVPILSPLTHKNLTVRHLLTMTSGIMFNETGSVTEKDWIRCFFESAMIPEPGKQFAYNSMNTYMLSAIIKQVSGQGLTDYLQERLWGPLGITEIFWEKCPKGIEKGGWGLYIRPEDLAKIGQLVLQKGRWGDRQLISEDWIAHATGSKTDTPAIYGGYQYGHQIWVGRDGNSFLFNGIFSQNVLGFPDSGILIVSNAGNDELFLQSNFFTLVDKYFSQNLNKKNVLPENSRAYRHLKRLQGSLRQVSSSALGKRKTYRLQDGKWMGLSKLCTQLSGRIYLTEAAAALPVSILPLLTQAIQNNYGKGVKSLAFSLREGHFIITVNETDETYSFTIGFDKPMLTNLSFHDEPYRVGVTGWFAADEQNRLVLMLRFSFLEIANARLLKITFHGNTIITKWVESPGRQIIINAFDAVTNEIKFYPFLESVIRKLDKDYIHYKIDRVLEPEVLFQRQL